MSFDPVILKEIEIIERMISRLLLQFQHAPVMIDILCAFSFELQFLIDNIGKVVVERSPFEAVVEQLNALGRIVGQPRCVIDFELADDDQYRRLIEAKVFRNFAQFASVPENQEIALLAFDAVVSFKHLAPMRVGIIVPDTTTLDQIKILTNTLFSFGTNQQCGRSIMPYDPVVSIEYVIIAPELWFAPDIDHVVDVYRVAVKWFI